MRWSGPSSCEWSRPAAAAALVAVALFAIAGAGCGKKRTAPVTPVTPPIGSFETGIASWYGHPYHGRRAANGEVYDMDKFTAAHRTLSFGTWVRVRNLTNGKTIDVRINDRGPFVDGRIIDLSRSAARAIDLIGPGTAKVRLEIIAPPAGTGEQGYYAVQVGAFRDRDRAEQLRLRLKSRYGDARLVRRDADAPLWRVLVGREFTLDAAAGLAARLNDETGSAFVVRLDALD